MDRYGNDEELNLLMEHIESIDSYGAQILLREAYEITYGLFDHSNRDAARQRPLALVAMHAKENSHIQNALIKKMERFVLHEINKRFGYNLTEFLNLPRNIQDQLFIISANDSVSAARELKHQLHKLESQ